MSDHLVVDSSAAFKWFAPRSELGRAQALVLLEKHRAQSLTLAAPTLLRLEVLNGFWKRGATAADLEDIANTLDGFRLAWFELTAALSSAAAHAAAAHRLTVYDATFVALALQLDTELVTEDRALLRSGACRLRALGA